ncbi:hypothetical protein B0H17DRAFT_1039291 [Mycena rosella]|uniref:Uncharacterized protein n=1 Tax=Mycena rosella TaxID=1033263 RepID=A0AAD7GSG7_MYCRO|nr:hypothetical protein B0H17DRAFT_1039291 [Mycena rosella]
MAPRAPFSGSVRKFVLGIDIGTTFAGMSYCLLEPGKVPSILPVTRFPAQDHVGGDSKVPSVIYYDRSGSPKACGAEALQEAVVEEAEAAGWEKAEWFKLHLRPTTSSSIRPNTLPPLPANKSALNVLADFLRYLFQCAKSYIGEHYPNGNAMWITLESTIEFVLTHPNGWEGEQQAKMRTAAIIAGLIPNTSEGHERIHFVTEGEASLNFCITNGLATDPLRLGQGVVIVDAGGGTVDISTYRKVTTPQGESFEEIARPECLFVGSIFVSNRAAEYLQTYLRGSRYADDVEHIRQCFDKTAKLRFRRTDEWSYTRFGGLRDRDEALNIFNGQMKLPGTVVAGFFRPSLDAIVQAIMDQQLGALALVSSVLLVGGFAASEWLYSELKKQMNARGLEVSRPDSHVNKAVADGAVSFYLDHFVSARISKHTHGIECMIRYDVNNSEHRARETLVDAAGDLNVTKMFSAILKKNIHVSETKEFRRPYLITNHNPSGLWSVDIPILRYSGVDEDPQWVDIDPDKYSVLCTVHADTSKLANNLQRLTGRLGTYYQLNFEVILAFGLTELKAQIAWVENDVEKRGPAELVY